MYNVTCTKKFIRKFHKVSTSFVLSDFFMNRNRFRKTHFAGELQIKSLKFVVLYLDTDIDTI